MATIRFINADSVRFEIGLTSMRFLNEVHSVFDKFNEDEDYYSARLLKVNSGNTTELANKIKEVTNNDTNLRKDLADKIIKLAEFIETSKGFEAFID